MVPAVPLPSPMNAWTVLEMSVIEIEAPMPTCAAVMTSRTASIVITWLSANTVTSSPAVITAPSSIQAWATMSAS